jgi:hypothetical protein
MVLVYHNRVALVVIALTVSLVLIVKTKLIYVPSVRLFVKMAELVLICQMAWYNANVPMVLLVLVVIQLLICAIQLHVKMGVCVAQIQMVQFIVHVPLVTLVFIVKLL